MVIGRTVERGAQLFALLHGFGGVQAHGDQAAARHRRFVDLQPGAVGRLLQARRARAAAALQTFSQPRLFAAQRIRHLAARHRTAQQGFKGFAEQGSAGHVRVELQHALVEEHEAVAAVVDLDRRRHRFDGVGHQLMGALGLASRRIECALVLDQLGDVHRKTKAAAVGQALLGDASPAAVGHLAQERSPLAAAMLGHALGDPRLFAAGGFGHHAAQHARAQQFFERHATRRQTVLELVEAAELGVGQHQAVVGVVEHDAGLHGVERVLPAQPLALGRAQQQPHRDHQHHAGQQRRHIDGAGLCGQGPCCEAQPGHADSSNEAGAAFHAAAASASRRRSTVPTSIQRSGQSCADRRRAAMAASSKGRSFIGLSGATPSNIAARNKPTLAQV